MVVSPGGKVEINDIGLYHARFSRITTHRLSISGVSCSGPGTYRWKVASQLLKLKKIHDACKGRVGQLAGTWVSNKHGT